MRVSKSLRPFLAVLLVVLGTAAILWLMGRPLTYKVVEVQPAN